ncbi:MAG: substrate-binding domain-containing protein [Coriobacteriia bacterium]|nr:substrate-binding domain-containing protein [Coriobacteriia bacterium]
MKRRYSFLVLLVLMLPLALTGCESARSKPTTGEVTSVQIRVSGSGTCLPLLRILTDEYSATHKGVTFTYLPGLHSGGGIKGVASGDLELGAVSRELTDEEKDVDLEYVQLSDDGLVVAVHPTVTIDGISSEQVRSIYAGEYDNWAQLGGPDLPMVILDRNEDESAKIILRKYVLGPEVEITPKAVNLFYEPDMVDGLQKTPGAVGYFSLGLGLSRDIPVNYLKLDGVEATVANIENGAYEMVRPLGVVAKRPARQQIADFLEWATGDEAADLMQRKGFAPVLSPAGE